MQQGKLNDAFSVCSKVALCGSFVKVAQYRKKVCDLCLKMKPPMKLYITEVEGRNLIFYFSKNQYTVKFDICHKKNFFYKLLI